MSDEYTTSFLGDYQGYMEQENKTVQELEEELQQQIAAQSNQSGLMYPSQFMIPGSMIGYLYIKDATITAATIASAAIGRAHIQDLAVNSAKIDVAAIGTAHMQDASIVRAKIQNGEIVNAHIENATITGAKIGGAAIDTAHIKEGAITNLLLGTAVVKTANIEDLSVTDAKILTLTANKLIAGTIDTSLVSVQGPNGKLRLTGNRIQVFDTQAVPVERVSMGDVKGDGTVYGFLMRGADGVTVLMDINGVKNAGITDGAITNPKIGDNAVNNRNIIADTITGNKLVVDAITAREIAARTITAQEIKTQTILAEHIQSLAGLNVNNQFIVDAAGNVKFSGNLEGASGTFTGRVYGSEIEGSLIKSSDKPNYDDPAFLDRAKMEAGKFILESKKTAETVGTILTLSGYGMKVDGPADDRELGYPLEYRDSTQSTEFQNGGILVNPVTGKQPTFFIAADRFGAGDSFMGNLLIDTYYFGQDPNLSTGAAYVRWDAGNFGRIEFNNMFMNSDSIMSIRNADNNDALMTFYDDKVVVEKPLKFANLTSSIEIDAYGNIKGTSTISAGAYWGVVDANNQSRFRIGVGTTYLDNNHYVPAGGKHSFNTVGAGAIQVIDDGTNSKLAFAGWGMIKWQRTNGWFEVRNYADSAWENMKGLWLDASSIEYKKDIEEYTGSALDLVLPTTVFTYRQKNESEDTKKSIGLISQHAPELITDKNMEGVSSYGMTALAWKAIQELHEEMSRMQSEIDQLRNSIM